MKLKKLELFILNLIFIPVLYYLMFILFPENNDYFYCNKIYNSNLILLNFKLAFPISCDLKIYFESVKDLTSITTYGYNYQNRPLYIIFLNMFYSIFKNLLIEVNLINFLTVLSAQIVIFNTSYVIFLKILENADLKIALKERIVVFVLFLVNPITKFGIFDVSHQTFTLIVFLLIIYFIQLKPINRNYIYLNSLLLGILSLANVIFLICYPFLQIFNSKIRSINLNKITTIIFSALILLTPKFIWYLYIEIFEDGYFDSATQYWRQFIWIKDYILVGYENVNYNLAKQEFYCMSVPLFIKCYFTDLLNTIFYLCIPISVFSLSILFDNKNNAKKLTNLQINTAKIGFKLFIFWLFIGWYPPLRFILYSFGHALIVLLVLQYLKMKDLKNKNFLFITTTVYLLSLNHWNSINVLEENFGIFVSIVMTLIYLIYNLKNLGISQIFKTN